VGVVKNWDMKRVFGRRHLWKKNEEEKDY